MFSFIFNMIKYIFCLLTFISYKSLGSPSKTYADAIRSYADQTHLRRSQSLRKINFSDEQFLDPFYRSRLITCQEGSTRYSQPELLISDESLPTKSWNTLQIEQNINPLPFVIIRLCISETIRKFT